MQDQYERMHKENMKINEERNELAAQLRQIKGQYSRLQTKLKRLELLQRMREQRFKDQINKIAPIVIQIPANPQPSVSNRSLTEGILQLALSLMQKVVSATQSNSSSFLIFESELKEYKQCYGWGGRQLINAFLMTNQINILNEGKRNSMNEWVIRMLKEIQIKQCTAVQKLFKMLGVNYRSKYPISGEQYELDQDVMDYLATVISKTLRQVMK